MTYKRFFKRLFFLTLILATTILALGFDDRLIPHRWTSYLWYSLGFFSLLTAATFTLAHIGAGKKGIVIFMAVYFFIFLLRLAASAGVFIYLTDHMGLNERELIFPFLGCYILYTVMETRYLIRYNTELYRNKDPIPPVPRIRADES